MTFELGPFTAIADRVFIARAEPASVTIGLLVGEESALVIDTGSSPTQGAAILAAAQEQAGSVPVRHAVITHAHADHYFGLGGLPGVSSVAHRGLVAAARAAEEQAKPGVTPTELVEPSRTFSLATTIDLGACYVEIVHFGRGHTDHDVVVLVPGRGVVFAGDLLESEGGPWAGEDTWPTEWPQTLDGMLGTLNKASVVVPGHGPLMSREDAFAQRAELAWYGGKAEELYDARTPARGAWHEGAEWPWPQAQSEAFLEVAMRRLAASGRRPSRSLRLLT